MIRGLFTLGFVLFLAAAGVWAYRHYGLQLPEFRQAETKPSVTGPQQDAPAPTPIPYPPVTENAPPPAPIPQPVPEQPQPPLPAPQPPQLETPQPAPPQTIPNPPTPRLGKRTHLVQPGETLWEISRKYFNSGAYVEAIADANHMDAPNSLRPGMVLILPEVPDPSQRSSSERPVRRSTEPEHVTAPRREAPMPPTLSRNMTPE